MFDWKKPLSNLMPQTLPYASLYFALGFSLGHMMELEPVLQTVHMGSFTFQHGCLCSDTFGFSLFSTEVFFSP